MSGAITDKEKFFEKSVPNLKEMMKKKILLWV